MRRHLLLGAVVLIGLSGYASDLFADDKEAVKAFETVQKVFQSPRCQNCHIPGDSRSYGGRDFAALIKHVSEDKLVLWGWRPGEGRAPVPVPHHIFVTRFKLWADAGGPCPVAGS